jgi:hypothetical protein
VAVLNGVAELDCATGGPLLVIAGAGLTKRVERISRKAMGDKAGVTTDALTWAGTFHGIGHAYRASTPSKLA